jgi:hypothetical protein
MTVAVAFGEYERMVVEAEAALRPDLPSTAVAMVRLELGLALFELGHFDRAKAELEATRVLLADGAALDSVVLAMSGDAVQVLLGMMAHFHGDEPSADALLAQARAQVGDALPRQVVAAFGSAWLSASRGDPQTCAGYAAACTRIGLDMHYPAYVGMGQMLSGWAAAMMGDPTGAHAADLAYRDYVSDGTRLHTPIFSVLRAEAHAHHGRLDHARELVTEARRVSAQTGERSMGPRLSAVAAELGGTEQP